MLVIDMDDTLCRFNPRVAELMRTMFGVRVDLSKLTPSWMKDPLTDEQFEALDKVVCTPEFYLSLKPVFNSMWLSDTLHDLHKKVGITYVTGRQRPLGIHAGAITQRWLRDNSLPVSDVVVCSHLDVKADLLPQGTKCVVEDSLHVIKAVEGKGIPTAVIDWPWNRNHDSPLASSRRFFPKAGLSGFMLSEYLRETV